MDFGYWNRVYRSRWLVMVAAIWIQSWAGIGYVFGSMSPVIKSSLNYNQKQINSLGVAKDIGDAIGLLGGYYSEILPSWAILLWGAMLNFIGYGWLWLLVCHKLPQIPFWAVCLVVGIGTNGETYFSTISLVSCVKSFPKNRGPVVGTLKGFVGLCGAILTQYYVTLFAPNEAAFIFLVAVGPSVISISLMFILRPVGVPEETDPSDDYYFNFVHGFCLLVAAYLLGIMIVQDIVEIGQTINWILTVVLLVILISPLALPLISTFKSHYKSGDLTCVSHSSLEARLLDDNRTPTKQSSHEQEYQRQNSTLNWNDVLLSEIEDEKPKEIDLLPEEERQRCIARLQASLVHATAEGAVRIKGGRGPRRGENFTLMQAIIKADFWLLFFSLFFGGASGLTVINNLGQICKSLGYESSHIFVSLISIWNFLGHIGGGFISEIVARDYAYPRPATLAAAQIILAIGHMFCATGWPGTLYIGTLLVGLGYGALWAIMPATASEIFGLKNFGTIYNFFIMANPAGTLIFSGLIAGTLYDWEAEKQHRKNSQLSSLSVTDVGISSGPLKKDMPLDCHGTACFFLTFLIMTGVCIIAVVLSIILVYRTRIVYKNIYGKKPNSEEWHLRTDSDLQGQASSSDLRFGMSK